MKKSYLAASLAIAFAPALSVARAALDGAWKADLAIGTIGDERLQFSIDGNADRFDANYFAIDAPRRLVTQQ